MAVAFSWLAVSNFFRTSQLTAACAELGEPQVDEKAGRTAIMADQVARQHVHDAPSTAQTAEVPGAGRLSLG